LPRLGFLGALCACLVLSLSKQSAAFQAPSSDSANLPSNTTPQLIPRTHEEREKRFLTQHRIILNVRVADASGKPLRDLTQGDFTLLDNDQPRKLGSFKPIEGNSAPAPAHVILVLDTVNSFTRQLHNFDKEIEKYLKQSERPLAYPMAIGVFSGSSVSVGQPSRDREALLGELKTRTADIHATGCITSLDRGEAGPSPNFIGNGKQAESTAMLSCLNDRFTSSVMALRQLTQQQMDIPGRVILIWIGSGWPLLTNRGFTPDPPELKRSFFNQLVSVSMAMREGQVTLDAVASPDDSPNPEAADSHDAAFFGGVSNEDQIRAGNLGLHALAHQSGGHIFTDARDVAGQINECIADAESYYVLAFDSPAAAAFGEYHSLAVKVDKPALDVRTNTLYYAEQ